MSTEKTTYPTLGDVLIHEGPREFTRDTKTVTNSSGSTMSLVPGHPMDDNVPVASGSEANADGLCAERIDIPDGESRDVAVIVRGPVVINWDKVPDEDYAEASYTKATLKTAIEALEDFVVRDEPTNQEEQTT